MNLWRFQGSAEEFAVIAASFMGESGKSESGAPEAAMVQELKLDDEETRFVTEDEASHILNRLELSRNMKKMLAVLKRAKSRVLSEDIREDIGLNSDQFRGMTGAFGRRVSHSVPSHVRFFDARWEPEHGQYSWLLPDTVKAVLSDATN